MSKPTEYDYSRFFAWACSPERNDEQELGTPRRATDYADQSTYRFTFDIRGVGNKIVLELSRDDRDRMLRPRLMIDARVAHLTYAPHPGDARAEVERYIERGVQIVMEEQKLLAKAAATIFEELRHCEVQEAPQLAETR